MPQSERSTDFYEAVNYLLTGCECKQKNQSDFPKKLIIKSEYFNRLEVKFHREENNNEKQKEAVQCFEEEPF